MMRKRSRVVISPQIDDHSSNNNSWLQHEKSTKQSSFFFNSPKFFKGFFCNTCSTDTPSTPTNCDPPIMSPTSILDTKALSTFANSFWIVDNNTNNNKNSKTFSSTQHSWEQPNNTKGIGLALIDENNITEPNNNNDNNNNNITTSTTKQQRSRKLVVFGSQLRIQVPPLPQSSAFPCYSPESPREFGIKTPRNNLWPFSNKDSQVHPQNISPIENGMIISEKGNEIENISLSDMELSEDYTCVIHNGPNPKTTHIFGNCIVESCCGVVGSSSFSARKNGYLSNFGNSISSHHNFLSFCHHCKKKLCEGSDIYMYRGEKAFCSEECRSQGMLCDGIEN